MKCAVTSKTNQPKPFMGYNLYETDPLLKECIKREKALWAEHLLHDFGRVCGQEATFQLGFEANENPPTLEDKKNKTHFEEVRFHLSWHRLMKSAIEHELHSLPWTETRPGRYAARAALMILASQVEAGHLCPVSMTFSSLPALRHAPQVFKEWKNKILSKTYDERFLPSSEKSQLLIGMTLTEQQGGSDLRMNKMQARPLQLNQEPGALYALTGEKWFCSAPMSDGFLILAQAPRGLSCFFLPRWTPEGVKNNFYIRRLKPKLGNRSNASAEIELDHALAWLVGNENEGVQTILEMIVHTRWDCALISTGLMRQALVQAIHFARNRTAFKKKLVEHKLMQNVLMDLCLEVEAATLLCMRLARAFEERALPVHDTFLRLTLSLAKYWICKRASLHIGEAMECLGGNGYIEDSILPRLYREAPVNAIWEGSSNIICLDVIKTLKNHPNAVEILLEELNRARGLHTLYDQSFMGLQKLLQRTSEEECGRVLTEQIAILLQASLLQSAPSEVVNLFCESRLGQERGFTFGATPWSVIKTDSLLERALPVD